MRNNNRKFNEIRPLKIEVNYNRHAEGSCIIKCGNTHIICTATIDDIVPKFLKGKNSGWITAEYGMLPRSTNFRMKREVTQGKPSGRTHEIQRLISRSLRAAVDLKQLGPRQILVDCDVISADGGTRCAAISGGYVALYLACQKLVAKKTIKHNPVIDQIAAISCGIYDGKVYADLDYEEDSNADTDANFVMNNKGNLIELQATAEKNSFTKSEFNELLDIAENATKQIFAIQTEAIFQASNMKF